MYIQRIRVYRFDVDTLVDVAHTYIKIKRIRYTKRIIDDNLVITYTYTKLRRIHNKNMTYTYFFIVDYSFYGFSMYFYGLTYT